MRTIYQHRHLADAPLEPPPVTCAVCGVSVPLAAAHSIAITYVGQDAQRRWRMTECDADQPFACSQAHAITAALHYHRTIGPTQRAAWQQTEPNHPPLPMPHPEEQACHSCGASRDASHLVAFVGYRCTGEERIAAWHCPHLLCATCLDAGLAACTGEHLPAQHAAHVARHPRHAPAARPPESVPAPEERATPPKRPPSRLRAAVDGARGT